MDESEKTNADQISLSRELLIKSQSSKQWPQETTIDGRKFVVFENVFSPLFFGSTEIFTKIFPDVTGKSILEIGCGTGITSVVCALRGAASVLAVDINPDAITNTRENAKIHNVQDSVTARESNVFSNVEGSETFDIIYWNAPFIYVDQSFRIENQLQMSLFDLEYALIETFIEGSIERLSTGGQVLLGWSNFARDDALRQILDARNLIRIELGRELSFEGRPVEFILLDLRSDK